MGPSVEIKVSSGLDNYKKNCRRSLARLTASNLARAV